MIKQVTGILKVKIELALTAIVLAIPIIKRAMRMSMEAGYRHDFSNGFKKGFSQDMSQRFPNVRGKINQFGEMLRNMKS